MNGRSVYAGRFLRSRGKLGSALTLAVLLLCSPLVWGEEVWIDVRTLAENLWDGIDGDPLIPHTEIVEEVSRRYPDKTTELHLYCGSGRRAGEAAAALEAEGYQHVINAGGIDDARRQRGLQE